MLTTSRVRSGNVMFRTEPPYLRTPKRNAEATMNAGWLAPRSATAMPSKPSLVGMD